MAKGKSANPADAHRKAMRAKELKKHKEARKKANETKTLKSGTAGLDAEIRRLKDQSQNAPLDAAANARLVELESEVKRIKSTKEKYVAEHPEHRKLIYPEDAKRAEAAKAAGVDDKELYDSKGRLRDPKRSIYYDPVMNPFGVPPPGMPYREHPSEHDEDDTSSDDSDDDDDDDIVMPEGPPPGDDADEDSDDDIPLPDGPAPYQIAPGQFASQPPLPPGPPPGARRPFLPPFPGAIPQQPLAFTQPPLHTLYPPQQAPPQTYIPNHNQHRPPPPPLQAPVIQETHQASQHELPPRPSSDAGPSYSAGPAAAVISAAPQIRDLRKETTVFVPRGVKKKKAQGGATVVDAAPGTLKAGQELEKVAPGGGLMGKLNTVLGDKPDAGGAHDVAGDYQRFLDGLGDIS